MVSKYIRTESKNINFFATNLPVLSVLLLWAITVAVYVWGHCIPLLQVGTIDKDLVEFTRGLISLTVVGLLGVLFLISYVRAWATSSFLVDSPLDSAKDQENVEVNKRMLQQLSMTRRFCKWCDKFKPYRCHHCRVCRQCIAKMDHHCPWIVNCVGWRNHKFFILTILYGWSLATMVAFTMFPSVQYSVSSPAISFGHGVSMVVTEACAIGLSLVLFSFLLFHLELVRRDLTTLEYCENLGLKGGMGTKSVSGWDKYGVGDRLIDTFGNSWFWAFLPVDNRVCNAEFFIICNSSSCET